MPPEKTDTLSLIIDQLRRLTIIATTATQADREALLSALIDLSASTPSPKPQDSAAPPAKHSRKQESTPVSP